VGWGVDTDRAATRLLAGPGVADPMVVVVIATSDLDGYVYQALRAGACGFPLEDAGPDLLVRAVRSAADGDALIAPSVTVRLLRAFADIPVGRPATQPISPVTDREEEVLLAVARGLTNTEIADTLHISLSTVKTHLASLMAKLGARNRVEIAMWAYETRRIVPGARSRRRPSRPGMPGRAAGRRLHPHRCPGSVLCDSLSGRPP
jgi:DNA-binding NarL/FixJ family response regulator